MINHALASSVYFTAEEIKPNNNFTTLTTYNPTNCFCQALSLTSDRGQKLLTSCVFATNDIMQNARSPLLSHFLVD